MPWNGGVAFVAGLLTGTAAGWDALRSLRTATLSGLDLVAIPAMWAVGIATTATGVGTMVYFGLGLAGLWWRERQSGRANAPLS
jgi:ribulose 1,5-bisphosphate carboxylase large subunit-like protein